MSDQQKQLNRELGTAVLDGDLKAVESALQAGAELGTKSPPHERDTVSLAIREGDVDILRCLIQSVDGNQKTEHLHEQALYWASSYGNGPMVKYLIEECGVDAHAYGGRILKRAAYDGHPDILQYLIEKCGVAIHVSNETMLFCAIQKGGNTEVVQYLLENRGANLEEIMEQNVSFSKDEYTTMWHKIQKGRRSEEQHNDNLKSVKEVGGHRPVRRRSFPSSKG